MAAEVAQGSVISAGLMVELIVRLKLLCHQTEMTLSLSGVHTRTDTRTQDAQR